MKSDENGIFLEKVTRVFISQDTKLCKAFSFC